VERVGQRAVVAQARADEKLGLVLSEEAQVGCDEEPDAAHRLGCGHGRLVRGQDPRRMAVVIGGDKLGRDHLKALLGVAQRHACPPGERGRCRRAEGVDVAAAELDPCRFGVDRRARMLPDAH
jgi:hypothetical protein